MSVILTTTKSGISATPPWLLTLVFGAILLFLSILSGLVATTASPLLIGLLAALIGGVFLLAKPDIAITLVIFIGLSMGALLSISGPAFSKLTWVVSLLGFLLFIPALLNIHQLRNAPFFINIAIAFMLLGLLVTVTQWHSTAEVVAGIKRGYQAFGLLFALALLTIDDKTISRWQKLVLFIAALQLPFAIYEFLVLVPKRGGLQIGSAVTDVVAGTFGANLVGGSPNSVMALFLLIVLAFLLSRWRARLMNIRILMAAIPLVMLPIALGEVKISFVLLPLMMLVVFKQDLLRRPAIFASMLVFGALLVAALGFIYTEYIIRKPLNEILQDTYDYNVGGQGYGQYYLNRTTVLPFWWQQQGAHDPIGFVFGHGLGSSFTAATSLVPGHLSARWPMYGLDLTAASTLLWDTGVLGFMLFMLIFLAAWMACNVLIRESQEPVVRADANAIRAIIPMFVVFVFYNNTIVNLNAMQLIYAMVLGYLAHLYARHRRSIVFPHTNAERNM